MDTSKIFHEPRQRWTAESVARLCGEDILQLRENALALGAEEVVALCDAALPAHEAAAPRSAPAPRSQGKSNLVPRRTAFQARGVTLHEGMASWGGVRSSDGMVVFSLWAQDIRQEDGACSYLLWAPNVAGSRPWSDTRGGKERLQHCKLAHERGTAEGLLVHGVRRQGFLPEDRASTIKGVDRDVVIVLQVVQRGAEYWAVWGRASSS